MGMYQSPTLGGGGKCTENIFFFFKNDNVKKIPPISIEILHPDMFKKCRVPKMTISITGH